MSGGARGGGHGGELNAGGEGVAGGARAGTGAGAGEGEGAPALLSVRDLAVTFSVRPRGDPPWARRRPLKAVRGVSFDLGAGEALGIVGESGSGKSTLARALIGTVPASGGRAIWRGEDLLAMAPRERHRHRRDIQMVFQDPLAALDPRMTAGEIIAEPLVTHEPGLRRTEVRARVAAMMERVGLLAGQLNRYPHEFSGGQCQRIGIARALIVEPRLVICDEPVSALDVSVQSQVINLLGDLRRDLGIALVFIAHDLSVVKHISDRIMVLYLGRVMEIGRRPRPRPFPPPSLHPRSRRGRPDPGPGRRAGAPSGGARGRPPFAPRPPSGCVFRTRCPVARPSCAARALPLSATSETATSPPAPSPTRRPGGSGPRGKRERKQDPGCPFGTPGVRTKLPEGIFAALPDRTPHTGHRRRRSRTSVVQSREPGSAMPDSSTGGRSGNLAIRERLPPMASTVFRSVESSRSLRCSSRETPSWLMPSSRARLT